MRFRNFFPSSVISLLTIDNNDFVENLADPLVWHATC